MERKKNHTGFLFALNLIRSQSLLIHTKKFQIFDLQDGDVIVTYSGTNFCLIKSEVSIHMDPLFKPYSITDRSCEPINNCLKSQQEIENDFLAVQQVEAYANVINEKLKDGSIYIINTAEVNTAFMEENY